jgi:excisionase family DNA binding protein
MSEISPEYYNTTQAAEYLGLSRQFLEIARHRGEGPEFIKIGRAVRYKRTSLDEFMDVHLQTITTGRTPRARGIPSGQQSDGDG